MFSFCTVTLVLKGFTQAGVQTQDREIKLHWVCATKLEEEVVSAAVRGGGPSKASEGSGEDGAYGSYLQPKGCLILLRH